LVRVIVNIAVDDSIRLCSSTPIRTLERASGGVLRHGTPVVDQRWRDLVLAT
jgi:hypothetical protein